MIPVVVLEKLLASFPAKTYWFSGKSQDVVLIIAGIHVSEQSGVEIANWIRVKLANRKEPTRFGALVVPEIFPVRGVGARTDEWQRGVSGLAKWREQTDYRGRTIYPARFFPPPGRPLSSLGPQKQVVVDGQRFKLLPEIEFLIRLIEKIKPVRIVSAHGKYQREKTHLQNARKAGIIEMTDAEIDDWARLPAERRPAIKGINFPGIFVDPRYRPTPKCQTGTNVEECKFSFALDPAFPLQGDASKKRYDSAVTDIGKKDDALALAAAKAIGNQALVIGNHVDENVPVVHYAKEDPTPQAYSLGDWGAVDVHTTDGEPGARLGAPVFTIETKDNDESWAFIDGAQVMSERGDPVEWLPPPAARAPSAPNRPVLPKGRAFAIPDKFKPERSKELQAYADAIINTILEIA